MNTHLVRLTALFGMFCAVPSFTMQMAYRYQKKPIKISSINISDNSFRRMKVSSAAKELKEFKNIHRLLWEVTFIHHEASAYQILKMKRDTIITDQQTINDAIYNNTQIFSDLMLGIQPIKHYIRIRKDQKQEIDDCSNILKCDEPYCCSE